MIIMAENKMAEVAALLNQEFDKPFVIIRDSVYGDIRKEVIFHDKGFYYKGEVYRKNDRAKWFPAKEILYDLLVGEWAVIVDD